jgi:hypothetical protein
MLSITIFAGCHYVIMLNAVVLNVVMLNVVALRKDHFEWLGDF